MKSHELASLAEVTVRTLRHYHQIGVLAEPERGSNGYRDYTVHDLVRLLRIKRLAALGIPLERMRAMLDDEPNAQEELLDGLDRDIQTEIDRLRAQQSLIGLIRANEAAPDFPPELARYFGLFGGSGPSAIGRVDREQAILLAHLVGEAGTRQLAAVYETITATVDHSELQQFVQEFDQLPASADNAQIDELVDRFADKMRPVLAGLKEVGDEALPNEEQAMTLLADHQRGALNAAQEVAVERLVARLA